MFVTHHSMAQSRVQPKFAPARDSHMRDVVLKIVKKGSDEHRIYEDLLHGGDLSGKEFQGVMPPVAILDSQYDFSFVVMPRYALSSIFAALLPTWYRWGDCAPLGTLGTVGAILTLMRCLLKVRMNLALQRGD